jgi:hypothetical protein
MDFPFHALQYPCSETQCPLSRMFYQFVYFVTVTFRYQSHTAEHEVETPALSLFRA